MSASDALGLGASEPALLRARSASRTSADEIQRLWRLGVEARGILQRLGADASRLARCGVSAAVATAAAETDLLFPCEADPAFLIARGWSARQLFERALGRRGAGDPAGSPESRWLGGGLEAVCDPGRGVFAAGALPAAALPVAVGALFARRGTTPATAALVLVGPGGTATGDFHEGMNFAAVRGLPLVAIVLSERTARPGAAPETSSPREGAVQRLSDRAEAYGIPGETADASDLAGLRDTCAGALWRARAGASPAILEVVLPHAGEGEEPLARLGASLASIPGDESLATLAKAVETALDEAFGRAAATGGGA